MAKERWVAKNHDETTPDGEAEALEPDMNKKRKDRAATARPDETAALTSGLNPDVEVEDDDGSLLRRKTRSGMRDLQVPRSEATKSGTAESGRAKEPRVLEEDADIASNRAARFDVASTSRTVGPDRSGSDLDVSGAIKVAEKSLQQVEQSSSRISQLEAEISGLKDGARLETATLAAAKSKAERDAAAYKEDAATAHAMVRDISLAAEQKLVRAVEHAKAEAKREVLEKLEAKGFKLFADLEEARVTEGRMALLIALDGGEDDSGEE
ncbi:uncharacterized protein [Nicotiana sylvestris]|uniref:uncharacterized protein n=1 Tax=Nicotiana sylvestris TaxID=4096 RepID=UPI00388CAB9F